MLGKTAFALSLGVFGFGVIGCSAPSDGSVTGDDQEITETAAPFDQVASAFEIDAELDGVDGCSAELSFTQPGGREVPGFKQKPEPSRFEGKRATIAGSLEMPRYVSTLYARLTVRCSGQQALIDYEFAKLDSPELGKTAKGTGKVVNQTYSGGIASVAPALTLGVTAKEITPSAPVAASNCKDFDAAGEPVNRFYVRAQVDIGKDYPWTAPYGDDWKANLDLDQGKLKKGFEPKLKEIGRTILVYCRPAKEGDSLHLKLSLKEDDILVDDQYEPVEGEYPRGTTQRVYQQSKDKVGEKRSATTTIEVL